MFLIKNIRGGSLAIVSRIRVPLPISLRSLGSLEGVNTLRLGLGQLPSICSIREGSSLASLAEQSSCPCNVSLCEMAWVSGFSAELSDGHACQRAHLFPRRPHPETADLPKHCLQKVESQLK